MEKFFMVYMEGGRTPVCKHETIKSAEKEAKRLAEVHGAKTFILCTIKSYKINRFIEQDCLPDEIDINLPF